jgi:hypothetical protein
LKISLAVTPCDASLDVVCRQAIRLSKLTRLSTVSLKDNHLVKKTFFSFKASLSCAFLLFANNLQNFGENLHNFPSLFTTSKYLTIYGICLHAFSLAKGSLCAKQ